MNNPTTIEEEEKLSFFFSSSWLLWISFSFTIFLNSFIVRLVNLIFKEVDMIGSGELLVIMVVILILFGGKRLPEFAKSLGQGIREFKKACNGEEDDIELKTVSQEIPETKPIAHKTESDQS